MSLVLAGKKEMFDARPIELDGFTLTHNRAVAIDRPTIRQFQHALEFASATSESSPYWVGDLVAYADSRAEWKEKLSQAMSVTNLSEQRLHDLGWIARAVAPPERELSPSIEHSAVVAKMKDVREQRRWLKKAKTEGWNKRDFRLEVKAAQRAVVAKGTAELEGMFKVWLIDYPWKYNTTQPSGTSAQTNYKGLDIEKGIKMGSAVQAHTLKSAVAFFWVTAPMLYYASDGITPDPYRLITAWGFEPKTGGVWDKVAHNFGHYLSIRHEHLIIATRGKDCTPDRPTPMLDSIFAERKSDVHSEKPAIVYKMIERLYDGPYVELFARAERKGWTSWGDQVGSLTKAKAG